MDSFYETCNGPLRCEIFFSPINPFRHVKLHNISYYITFYVFIEFCIKFLQNK